MFAVEFVHTLAVAPFNEIQPLEQAESDVYVVPQYVKLNPIGILVNVASSTLIVVLLTVPDPPAMVANVALPGKKS
jgi:hypothetical protein